MLTIEELILRVPGFDEKEGRSLGNEVVRRVADELPAQYRSRHLDALDLNFRVPVGTSSSQLATLIAEAILKGLV
ncbi:MAG: hypothetical protein BBJ57_04300 [Desulfobacterales bacterium PC51MH44]|nr:MAG: hypothetical protein BBJ57_04300 [Desulfobacterales bacterium PC51MH44]